MPIDPPGDAKTVVDTGTSAGARAAIEASWEPVLYFRPEARAWVERWAGRLRLVECTDPPVQPEAPLLWAAPDHLELRIGGARDKGAWVTDAEVRRRVRQRPELVRACGLTPGMRVLDAMAGWGLDGMVLAAAGARVTMTERLPLLQVLQEDLIRRIGCVAAESILGDGFRELADPCGFDVVYLDPMFPERGKQALPGKRMQYLAVLAAAPVDDRPLAEWMERAIAVARHRVVVKRRLHDRPGRPPDWQIRGRSIRYDVYRGLGVALSAPGEPRSGNRDL